MPFDTQIRKRLIHRIQQIPENKLPEIEHFLEKMDNVPDRNHSIISFAGSWKDIDEGVLDEFTVGLISRRERNRVRNHE
jgi:hypothetical protein